MNNESKFIIEVWDLVRDQIAAPRRLETAASLIRAAEENLIGVGERELHDLLDAEDPYLTRAFYEVFPEEDQGAGEYGDDGEYDDDQ